MLVLMLSRALAVPADAECLSATLVESVPVQGAIDVPVDVAPVLVFADGSCGPAFPLIVTLSTVDAMIDERRYENTASPDIGGRWTLDLELPALDPATAYTLAVRSEWAGEQSQLGFTTGSAVAPEISGAPTVELGAITQTDHDGVIEVTAEVTVTPVQGGPAAMVVRGNDQERGVFVADGPTTETLRWADLEAIEELCVTAEERDARGDWHGPSASVCAPAPELVPATEERGCNHAPVGLAGLALAPLAFLRRRGDR